MEDEKSVKYILTRIKNYLHGHLIKLRHTILGTKSSGNKRSSIRHTPKYHSKPPSKSDLRLEKLYPTYTQGVGYYYRIPRITLEHGSVRYSYADVCRYDNPVNNFVIYNVLDFVTVINIFKNIRIINIKKSRRNTGKILDDYIKRLRLDISTKTNDDTDGDESISELSYVEDYEREIYINYNQFKIVI